MTIKKYYLLAVLGMAANMLVVNDAKAMEGTEYIDDENQNNDKGNTNIMFKILDPLACNVVWYENSINFVSTLTVSVANNWLKIWDHNKKGYFSWGCLGWRTGKFLNDYLQFDININLGRGIFYIAILFLYYGKIRNKKIEGFHAWTAEEIPFTKTIGLPVYIIQGFLSLPLVIYFPNNFSIAISLDSLIWAIAGKTGEIINKNEDEDEGEKIIDIDEDVEKTIMKMKEKKL